jgi:hypothetical protein
MSIVVFWVVTPCSCVGSYRSLAGKNCFELNGKRCRRHNPEDHRPRSSSCLSKEIGYIVYYAM